MEDKKKTFRTDISDRLEEIKAICKKEKIPFFTCFALIDGKEVNYVADIGTPAGMSVNIKNDKFPLFSNVLNGFKTVPYTSIVEEMDEDVTIKNNDNIIEEIDPDDKNKSVINKKESIVDEDDEEDEDLSIIDLD